MRLYMYTQSQQRREKRHKPRAAFALLLCCFYRLGLLRRTNVRSNCCFILRNCLSGYNIGRVITRTSLSFVNTKMSYCLGTQISWQMRYILSWLRKWKKMMETSDPPFDKMSSTTVRVFCKTALFPKAILKKKARLERGRNNSKHTIFFINAHFIHL